MAAIPLQTLAPGGAASTLVNASGGGDTCPAGDGIFLEVNNGSVSAVTVTLATPGTVNGLAIADRAITIPAGERWKIPVGRMYAKADGSADVTYSSATTVTVGAFRIV
ncbi:hypothetical protein AB0K40_17750 [Nonomuraea bangladeshensis]|uniref:DUF2190 family protein n=1 Tax=Nonomuraea bangladeshensis TaxID=404385 RepID=A0ABV3H4C2_9ACTN